MGRASRINRTASRVWRNAAAQYAFALFMVAAAAAVRASFEPLLHDRAPYQVFLMAVAVVGLRCDLYPTLLTILLGAGVGNFFFSTPRFSFAQEPVGWWMMATYLGSGAVIAFATQTHRRSARRLASTLSTIEQAQHALCASEARFAGIITSAMDAIISIGEDQRILTFNRAAEQIFRCPAAEALGQPLDRFMPERFRAFHRRHIEDFGRTGVTNRSMYRPGTLWGLRRDGEEFPIEATISQVEAQGQKLFTVILRDVTERVRVEEALRARSEELEAMVGKLAEQASLLELAFNAVIVWDLHGRVRYWSRGAEELYGWTRQEAMGKVVHDLLKTEYPQPLASITDQLQREDRWEGELIHTCKDGRRVNVLSRWAQRRDPAGAPGQVLEVNTDITARHQMEAALRASEERLEVAQQSAHIGSWEWDLRTGKVIWSQGVPALHGLPPDAFDGSVESWWCLIHQEDRESVRRAIEDALEGRRDYDVEFRTPWPDGSLHWVAARGRVSCDAAGRPLRMVGIGMDITQRKKTEETLRSAEKMIATGQIAATLAHEINNPLAATVNLAYILRSHPELPEELLEYAAMLDEELRRMSHIVRQTLSLYREGGAASVGVRLEDVIDEVLRAYSEKLNGLSVERRYQALCLVKANRVELHQLVSNLLGNAVEAFSVPDGSIKIHTFESRDWRNPDRTGVRIVVADSGTGIAPQHRRRMLEPFFTTKHQKGTGLGLSVVQWIAAKYGGGVRIHSSTRPGRSGTCVSVFLCAETSRKRATEPAATDAVTYRTQAS